MVTRKKIGLIATGDELIHGDIVNTNGQRFCQRFIDLGMLPGQQITVGDDCAEIEAAIRYLRQTHSAIITIGGLGPTIDDVTRRALANAVARPLEYHEEAWVWIVEKIRSLGYAEIPENNRQQTFFPKGAEIFRNFNGTAAACYVQEHDCDFFMLPGPPNECLALFEREVLPRLQKNGYETNCRRLSWLLIGVSEGAIAEQLEPLLLSYPAVQLGFRVSYPYLEVKLASEDHSELEKASASVTAVIQNHIVSTTRETASELLKKWLLENHVNLIIDDQATRGAFYSVFSRFLHDTSNMSHNNHNVLKITLQGLGQYWKNQVTSNNSGQDYVDISFEWEHLGTETKKTWRLDIPLRGERSIPAAIERISFSLWTAFTRFTR